MMSAFQVLFFFMVTRYSEYILLFGAASFCSIYRYNMYDLDICSYSTPLAIFHFPTPSYTPTPFPHTQTTKPPARSSELQQSWSAHSHSCSPK